MLASIYVNANRGKGKPAKPVTDFLMFRDAWKPEEVEEEPANLQTVLMAFGKVKRADNHS